MTEQQPGLPLNDPKNYRAMSEPWPDADSANAALSAFFTELRELRQKHRMQDVLCVVGITVGYDGADGEGMAFSHNGHLSRQLPMAAWVYGQAGAENREMLNQLAAGNRPKIKATQP